MLISRHGAEEGTPGQLISHRRRDPGEDVPQWLKTQPFPRPGDPAPGRRPHRASQHLHEPSVPGQPRRNLLPTGAGE